MIQPLARIIGHVAAKKSREPFASLACESIKCSTGGFLMQMRYFLGDAGRSLMTGFGKNPPTHVQNRAASCSSTNACDQANGLLSGGPNPHILYGAIPQFSDFSDSYEDLRTDNSSRVDLGINAATAGVCAGLTNAPGTWEQCLQGYGVLTKDTAVCNTN